MWGLPYGNRSLTNNEATFVAECQLRIRCRVLKPLSRLDCPLIGHIGPFIEEQHVEVPLYIVDLLVDEAVVVPLLPRWLHLEDIKQASSEERQTTDMLPVSHPYLHEISSYFFKQAPLVSWDTRAGADETVSMFASSQESIGGQMGKKRSSRSNAAMRTKVSQMYSEWVNYRRTKILRYLETCDNHPSSKVLSNLFQHEMRWLSPLSNTYMTKMRFTGFSLRPSVIDVELASLGINLDLCLDSLQESKENLMTVVKTKVLARSGISDRVREYVHKQLEDNDETEAND